MSLPPVRERTSDGLKRLPKQRRWGRRAFFVVNYLDSTLSIRSQPCNLKAAHYALPQPVWEQLDWTEVDIFSQTRTHHPPCPSSLTPPRRHSHATSLGRDDRTSSPLFPTADEMTSELTHQRARLPANADANAADDSHLHEHIQPIREAK